MSLDFMLLVCDVKYITKGYVFVGHAHVCSNNKSYQDDVDNNFNLKDIGAIDVIQEMKISNISDGLVLS